MAMRKLHKALIILCAILILLTGLYLLRYQLFGPLMRKFLGNQISNAMGTGIEFHVTEIRGSIFSDLSVRGFTTTTPAADGPLTRIDFAELNVEYNLFKLLTGPALDIVSGFETTRANLEVDVQWLIENQQPPGVIINSLYKVLPKELPLEANGFITFALGDSSLELQYTIEGSLPDGITLEVINPDGPILPLSDRDRITLDMSLTNNVLVVKTLRKKTASGIYLNLAAAAKKPPGKEAQLTSIDLVLQFAGFYLDTYADLTGLKVNGGINREDRVKEVLTGLFGNDFPIDTGSLAFDLKAHPIKEVPHQFLDSLLFSPVKMADYLQAEGMIAGDSWKIAGTSFHDISGSFKWANDKLNIKQITAQLTSSSGKEAPSIINFTSFTLDTQKVSFKTFPQGEIAVTLNSLDFLNPFIPKDIADYTALVKEVRVSAVTLPENRIDLEGLTISSEPISLTASGVIQIPALDEPLSAIVAGEGSAVIANPRKAVGLITELIPRLSLPQELDPGTSITGDFSIGGSLNNPKGRASITIENAAFKDIETKKITADIRYQQPVIQLEKLDVKSPSGTGTATGTINIEELSGAAAAAIAKMEFPDIPIESASLSAGFNYPSITVNTLTFTAAGETWRLKEPGKIRVMEPDLSFDTVKITSDAGAVSMKGDYSEDYIEAVLMIEDLRIPYITSIITIPGLPEISGTLNSDISLKGNPHLPKIEFHLTGDNISVSGEPGFIKADAIHDSSGIRINSLDLQLERYLTVTGSGYLPLNIGLEGINFGEFEKSEFSLSGSTKKVEKLFPESFNVPGISQDSEILVDLETNGPEAFLRADFNGLTGISTEEISETGLVKSIALNASIHSLDSETWKIAGDVSGSGISIFDGEGIFNLKDKAVSGKGELFIPLHRFAHLVPEPLLVKGTVKGTGDFSGTLTNPEIKGDLRIIKGMVKFAPVIPAVSSIDGSITIDKEGINNINVQGEMGHAPISITGKALFPLNPLPETLDIRIQGENTLLVRNPDLRVRADVDIGIADTNGDYLIQGTGVITDTLFTQNLELLSFSSPGKSPDPDLQLFSLRTPWADSVNFDVQITADNTIRVENNLARGDISADIHLGGTALVPRPRGKLITSSTKALLPLTTIQVETASLEFPAANPFTPKIRGRANARVRGYELTALVNGTLNDLDITVSSTPPLPPDEALLLILTGLQPGELTFTEDYRQAVITIGAAIGKEALEGAAGAISPEAQQFLERVTVQVGSDDPDAGLDTIDVEYRFSNSDNWFLRFQRDEKASYNIGLAWRFWFD